MKVEILIRDLPYNFGDFMLEHDMKPVIPENPLASIPIWTDGPGGIILLKDEYDGEPCYRGQHTTVDGLIKFLRALWKWDQE